MEITNEKKEGIFISPHLACRNWSFGSKL